MIKIDFSNKKIKVETQNVSSLFNLPLKLSVKSHVNKKDVWSSELNDWWWAEFPNNEIYDVVITEPDGSVIVEKKWEISQDGNDLYKFLYFYCKKLNKLGKKPKGIAIGAHDGLFGEWVPCVLDNITDCTLVEASQKQFEKLQESYSGYKNVKLINSLITTNGEPTEFYEGGEGYTNSIVERVIRNWEREEINSSIIESLSINDLITEDLDWIHTDVEGYDSKLIMAIDVSKLPKLIIFEYENLTSDENEMLKKYLQGKGFTLDYKSVSCIAIKK